VVAASDALLSGVTRRLIADLVARRRSWRP
jgi:hypothetical protein